MKAGGGHFITIGEMVRQFLVKLEWYSTLFPRIPVPVQKEIARQLKEYGAQAKPAVEEESYPQETEEHGHIADQDVSFGEAARISGLRTR